MKIANEKEPFILLLGDMLLLLLALYSALLVRYFAFPSVDLYLEHLVPFLYIFAVWIVAFFIAGLYEKHTLLLKSRLPSIILNVQMANSIIAISFFYLVPYFTITPKTNLFLTLFTSFILLVIWRLYIAPSIGLRRKQNALLIGSGAEMHELKSEVNNNPRYNLHFVTSLDLDELEGIDFKDEILDTIYSENISTMVVDLKNEKVQPILPHLYNLIFSKVHFIDMYKVYEDIFDRVPLTLVNYNWFIENISSHTKILYDTLKRLMDVLAALALGLFTLLLYPFVALAIKLDDGGPILHIQERIGKNNKIFKVYKFRSMDVCTGEVDGESVHPRVTRVGGILRATRIDELPQIFNVLRGDISLIGPRPELPELVKTYEREINYYDVRHLIKPGLSGWAQLYHVNPPKFSVKTEETRQKLSYDLYYIKNRSFMLDLKIALKTVKTLLSRTGV